MMDRDLALALRSSRPCPTLAYERLYDAYGDELFVLCRGRVGDPDTAQAALRDTFIVAGAHIHRLSDAERLAEWLRAIASAECEHHGRPQPAPSPVRARIPPPAEPGGRGSGVRQRADREGPGPGEGRGTRGAEGRCGASAREGAVGSQRAAAPTGLRLRVLSGLVGPDLAGHRAHVAARAASFDRDGFPVPPSRRPAEGCCTPRAVLPALAICVCVLLLAVLAVHVATRADQDRTPVWSNVPPAVPAD